jgi:hypothetical protein
MLHGNFFLLFNSQLLFNFKVLGGHFGLVFGVFWLTWLT